MELDLVQTWYYILLLDNIILYINIKGDKCRDIVFGFKFKGSKYRDIVFIVIVRGLRLRLGGEPNLFFRWFLVWENF
jgi:hypothetical protein